MSDEIKIKRVETRKIDEIGRVLIPKALRIQYDLLEVGTDLDIIPKEDGILIKKHSIDCAFCGESEDLITFNGKAICKKCLKEINENSRN